MASSRKPASAEIDAALRRTFDSLDLRGKRLTVALSGGVDSVVLLHALRQNSKLRLQAVHVHHGLSPNADAWADFCRGFCRRLGVALAVKKVRVTKQGKGLEAAARDARYQAFAQLETDVIALAHNLDDQAETVLMNLLRGAGARGASGMRPLRPFEGKLIARPLLDIPRKDLERHARLHRLEWIEDESNADEALTRNFVRSSLGPLIETRFPQWKRSLARAARLFSGKEDRGSRLLREFLRSKNLKAPSEAKLVEMLKQLTSGGARTKLKHDGATLRVYRGKLLPDSAAPAEFSSREWKGESRLRLPALGGELRFRKTRGKGIALEHKPLSVRLRAGGERLQPDPQRPRRTLKNLFQEAGVPPWERARLPLLFSGDDLVWVPGLGVDARFHAPPGAQGLVPEWRPSAI